MNEDKKISILISFLMCLLLSNAYAGTCTAASCLIQEQELVRLENNLTKLQEHNTRSQQELATLKTQLKTSQEKSTRLELQLADLKEKSNQAESLLQTANESLQKFAAEEQRTRRRLKLQRNIRYGLAIGMFISLAKR